MNNRIVFSAIAFLCYLSVGAQVGIGTKTPNDAAMLHIKHASKGLLIPSRTDVTGMAYNDTAVGLLFFNSTEKNFYYWDGAEWRCLSPLVATQTDKGIEDPTVTLSAPYTTVDGNFTGTFTGHHYGQGATPIGGIIMWYGETAGSFDLNGLGIGDLDGWALCNGKHNTPDLRGHFVVGYSDSLTSRTEDEVSYTEYDYGGNHRNNEANIAAYGTIGTIGGNRNSTIDENQLPPHTHTVVDPGHNHPDNFAVTSSGSTHKHTIDGAGGSGSTRGFDWTKGTGDDHDSHTDGAHTHGLSGSVNNNTTGITIENTGLGRSFSNMPPYYVLAFIMRVD